ncbi:uncharacterized protein [Coffea arabica]|uniref:Uncharacterized protein isoform X2 n=1 Tax=Coffea arabica TaxID=13443 RepID=A0A6P6X313_COFAR|nr:uncharacterized protein LOC113737187 isoform X2 [Coffea arabica]
MGCFLACFGFTKKRRRTKGRSKNASGDQSYGRYVPLDCDVTVKLECDEMQKASATELRDKPKESSSAKIKKKVSFNLNVKTYEPLPNDELSNCNLSEGEEKTMWEYNQEETAGASMKYFNYEDNLMASKIGSFPSNYRYQNCRDSYDEEDEMELEDSDLDDEDELDFDEDDIGESYDFRSQKLCQASVEEEGKVTTDQLAEKGSNLMQPQVLQHQEHNKTESNQNARNRSHNVFSVLAPVENLTQWKEVKAKTRQQLKHQKENIVLEQEQHMPLCTKKSSEPLALNSSVDLNQFKPQSHEIAVDASLSNWLVSFNGKDSNAAIANTHQKRSRWMHQTRSADEIELL